MGGISSRSLVSSEDRYLFTGALELNKNAQKEEKKLEYTTQEHNNI